MVSIGPRAKRTLKIFPIEIGTGPTDTESKTVKPNKIVRTELPTNNLARKDFCLFILPVLLNNEPPIYFD